MKPHYADDQVTLHHGDALEVLRRMPAESVNCVVTSPPYYGLRDYGEPGQYGLESTPAEYVEQMREVFAEVRRVLAKDGTLWLNLGDSYSSTGGMSGVGPNAVVAQTRRQDAERTRPASSLPPKNLLGIPWRVAFALQDDGWYLRNAITWHKPNGMPHSVTDRLTNKSEMVFLLTRSQRYWFDLDPIREPLAYPDALDGTRVFGGKNKGSDGGVGSTARNRGQNVYGAKGTGHAVPHKGSVGATGAHGDHPNATHPAGRNPGDVWSIPTQPFTEAHFAVMPQALAERCILAGCRPGGVVLDPFAGSGTTGMVALKLGRRFVGIDLSAKYLDLALKTRLAQGALVDEVSAG